MKMCEQEQAARIAIEDRFSKAEVWIEVGGRIVGALLFVTCIGAAAWSVWHGAHPMVTIGFLGVPVLGTIAKLFDRRR